MNDSKFRVFATCRIGEAIDLLRQRGYNVEVYEGPEAPPKKLILEKVASGIDGLITTLRDPIDAEVFEKAKKKAETPNLVMTPQQVVTFFSEMALGDKYREMYSILQDVERFIYDTGDHQLQMRIAGRLKAL